MLEKSASKKLIFSGYYFGKNFCSRAQGKKLGRREKDPFAKIRIYQLQQQGLSLRAITKQERLSLAGVLKSLRRSSDSTL